mmetsp:Transcript_953/g.2122  ORF Transcript_953/g.2122 Transcript_953/m.2122 type:complete len:207 (-) Transcript_953:933-1553(-)
MTWGIWRTWIAIGTTLAGTKAGTKTSLRSRSSSVINRSSSNKINSCCTISSPVQAKREYIRQTKTEIIKTGINPKTNRAAAASSPPATTAATATAPPSPPPRAPRSTPAPPLPTPATTPMRRPYSKSGLTGSGRGGARTAAPRRTRSSSTPRGPGGRSRSRCRCRGKSTGGDACFVIRCRRLTIRGRAALGIMVALHPPGRLVTNI